MNMAGKQAWITNTEEKTGKELKRNERKGGEKMINSKRGITLVALVITVIVLLILAGATVTVALNGEGIFSKADNAVTRWNDKVTQENQATGDLMNILYEMERVNATDQVTIALSPAEGSFGESVTATLSYANIPDGYVLQYLVKEPEAEVTEADWTTGNTATISVKGTQVRGRLYNGNLSTNKETAVSSWLTVNNIDKTAPTAPTGVETVQNKGNALVLKGTGATDDSEVVYYSYRYKTTSGSWSDWSAKVLGTENYTTGTLSLNTDYIIEVKAVDPLDRESSTTYTTPTAIKTAATAPYEGRIGQYVHYDVNLGIGSDTSNVDDDWVVFYEDTTSGYTYLIASDYVPVANSYLAGTPANGDTPAVQGALAKAGLSSSGTYFVKASSISNATTMDSLASTRYKLTWNGTINKLKHNATVALLNTTAWSGLALNANITAVGAPTVDLWVASWNQRGYTRLNLATNVADEGKDGTNAKNYGSGYYVGTAATPTTTSQSVVYNSSSFPLTGYRSSSAAASDPSVNNKVYFPRTTATSDNCYGYWLASPSAGSNSRDVMTVDCDGSVSNSNFGSTTFGARPVVSLPSSIIGAVGSTTGIYYIDGNVND